MNGPVEMVISLSPAHLRPRRKPKCCTKHLIIRALCKTLLYQLARFNVMQIHCTLQNSAGAALLGVHYILNYITHCTKHLIIRALCKTLLSVLGLAAHFLKAQHCKLNYITVTHCTKQLIIRAWCKALPHVHCTWLHSHLLHRNELN